MPRPHRLLALAPVLAAGLVAYAPAASAAPAACDAYSTACAPAPTGVAGETQRRPVHVAPARVAPAAADQLPFTGAQLTLVVGLGLGGVGLGTAMTVAGRRRRATQPA